MTLSITDKSINLKSIQDKDYSFLSKVYKSSREKELAQVDTWTEEQKDFFLDQQFAFQHQYYLNNYNGAAFYMIVHRNISIGRLYIHPNFDNKSIRIIDITILPEWQNKGFGSGLINDIKSEARKLKRSLTIHVESFNPAIQLYNRLGFKKISETNGVYYLLEWTP